MTADARRSWIDGLEPPVPDAFVGRLEGVDGTSAEAPGVDHLLAAALGALERALGDSESPRTDREAAFELLAADGLLTYACEAALAEDDPTPVLRRILGEVAEGGRGGSGGA